MKAIARVGFAAVTGTLLAAAASADYNKPLGASLHAGIFWTSSQTASSFEGPRWFDLGGDFKLNELNYDAKTGSSGYTTLSLDWYGKGGFSNIPVMYNYVIRKDQLYYSAGAGIGFSHQSSLTGSTSNTDFDYGFGIGYDFIKDKTPIFAELKYFGCSRPQLSGFALVGGFRF